MVESDSLLSQIISSSLLLLMAEILHHLRCIQNYQLVLSQQCWDITLVNPIKILLVIGHNIGIIYPCIQQWSARCPFHLLCYLKWCIYIYISNMVCMVLYALTGALNTGFQLKHHRGPVSPEIHTSDEPTNSSARCLWMHQAFHSRRLREEKMSPFSWVAPRCFLESLRWETGW